MTRNVRDVVYSPEVARSRNTVDHVIAEGGIRVHGSHKGKAWRNPNENPISKFLDGD